MPFWDKSIPIVYICGLVITHLVESMYVLLDFNTCRRMKLNVAEFIFWLGPLVTRSIPVFVAAVAGALRATCSK